MSDDDMYEMVQRWLRQAQDASSGLDKVQYTEMLLSLKIMFMDEVDVAIQAAKESLDVD